MGDAQVSAMLVSEVATSHDEELWDIIDRRGGCRWDKTLIAMFYKVAPAHIITPPIEHPLPVNSFEETFKDPSDTIALGPNGERWRLHTRRINAISTFFKNIPSNDNTPIVVDMTGWPAILIDTFVRYTWRGSYHIDMSFALNFVEKHGVDLQVYDIATPSRIEIILICVSFRMATLLGCESFKHAALSRLREKLAQPLNINEFIALVKTLYLEAAFKDVEVCDCLRDMVALHGVWFKADHVIQDHPRYDDILKIESYAKNSLLADVVLTQIRLEQQSSLPRGVAPQATSTLTKKFASATAIFGAGVSNSLPPSTSFVPFSAFQEKDGPETWQFQTITFQAPYHSYSLEELRLVDYNRGRRYGMKA